MTGILQTPSQCCSILSCWPCLLLVFTFLSVPARSSPFQIHDDSHVLKKMVEHQNKQQQQPAGQQPPFANPLPPGLALPWQAPNGRSYVLYPRRCTSATAP